MNQQMAVIMTPNDIEMLKQEITSSVLTAVGGQNINVNSYQLQMYSQEQVAEYLNVSVVQLTNLREVGIIRAIKTGKCYMFSAEEIMRMQREYAGFDISNRVKAIEAYNIKKATSGN